MWPTRQLYGHTISTLASVTLEVSMKSPYIDWPEDKPGDKEKRLLKLLRDKVGSGTVFIPKSWLDRNPFWKTAVEECDWLRVEPQ